MQYYHNPIGLKTFLNHTKLRDIRHHSNCMPTPRHRYLPGKVPFLVCPGVPSMVKHVDFIIDRWPSIFSSCRDIGKGIFSPHREFLFLFLEAQYLVTWQLSKLWYKIKYLTMARDQGIGDSVVIVECSEKLYSEYCTNFFHYDTRYSPARN